MCAHCCGWDLPKGGSGLLSFLNTITAPPRSCGLQTNQQAKSLPKAAQVTSRLSISTLAGSTPSSSTSLSGKQAGQQGRLQSARKGALEQLRRASA